DSVADDHGLFGRSANLRKGVVTYTLEVVVEVRKAGHYTPAVYAEEVVIGGVILRPPRLAAHCGADKNALVFGIRLKQVNHKDGFSRAIHMDLRGEAEDVIGEIADREPLVVVLGVHIHGERELAEVGGADGFAGGFARPCKHGK